LIEPRDAALTAIALTKRYGSKTALDGVELAVRGGRITALLGPNGAGKTTLLRLALGFERPDVGRIVVGPRTRPMSDVLNGIAYVPQRPAVYRALSVAEHLMLSRAYRPDFDTHYARRRLDELGILGTQRASSLSGGQAAQLGLAMALGTRAHLLLLDEPLASLDPLARHEFLQVLTDAALADGLTVVMSTHIVSDVMGTCDDLVILGAGKVLLADDIPGAIARHRIVPAETPGLAGTHVGTFAAMRGGPPQDLLRDPEGGDASGPGSPASLEQIVIGYLAGSRENKVQ
jgi:ABC-2 type transport system ATP-binding protein